MEKLTKAKKYFKKHIAYFLQNNDKVNDVDAINLLYNYSEYLKNSNYYDNFNFSEVAETLANEYPDTINKGSYEEGLKTMLKNMEPTIILLQKQVENLTQRLSDQKYKNGLLKERMLFRIQKLEREAASKPAEMFIAHKAFQAGADSVELIQRRPLNPELQPYFTIKRNMNFRTWANKVWKYGKMKVEIQTPKYSKIDENAFKNAFNPVDERDDDY